MLDKWTNRIASFVTFAILGHFLDVNAFGIVAMAATVTTLLAMLVDSGATESVIQRRNATHRFVATSFWYALISGTVFYTILFTAAPLLAEMYDEPGLVSVLRAMGLTLLLQSLSITRISLLMRDLQFKKLAFRRIASTIMGAVVGITWAVLSPSVWALVAQAVATATALAGTLWIGGGFRPSLTLNKEDARVLLGFGSAVLGIRVLTWLIEQGDNLLVGLFMGTTALGIYAVGYRIYSVAIDLVSGTLSAVALPAFSRLQNDSVRLSEAFLKATRVSTCVALPAFGLLAVIGPQVVPVMFGNQWVDSVPVMQVFCVLGLLNSATFFDRTVLIAVGRVRMELLIVLCAVAANVIVILIAVPHGINWVAVALTIRAYAFLPIRLWALRIAIQLPVKRYLLQWIGPIVAASASVAIASIVQSARPDLVGTFMALSVGMVAYIAILRISGPRHFVMLIDIGKAIRRKNQDSSAF